MASEDMGTASFEFSPGDRGVHDCQGCHLCGGLRAEPGDWACQRDGVVEEAFTLLIYSQRFFVYVPIYPRGPTPLA